MAVDTRDLIAQAVVKLLTEKKVKKLTVKDIVEECSITRQTFYYHFSDIPDLISWMLDRDSETYLKECAAQDDAEAGLRYLVLLFLQTRPILQQGLKTNYGEELQQLLKQQLFTFAETIADYNGLYQHFARADRQLILRYHCMAIWGVLQDWTDTDTKNLDHTVHLLYQLMEGKISPF